ncbi:MAG: hypothetical protein JW844_02135 [Candidatus Omnitrophica bacterium]|nr:hypothetical protein [Candidatus Omnitrophota bacterium]
MAGSSDPVFLFTGEDAMGNYAGKHRAYYLRHMHTVDFWQFLKDLAAFEKEYQIRKKQDEFLDLYSQYLKGRHEGDVATKIKKLATELHRLDPAFTFKLRQSP